MRSIPFLNKFTRTFPDDVFMTWFWGNETISFVVVFELSAAQEAFQEAPEPRIIAGENEP